MFESTSKTKTLSDLAEMVTVGIANSATHAYVNDGVLMFRNQNIKANELDDSDLIYIKPEFAKKYESKTLKANDILVARTGYPGTACLVPDKYAGAQTFTTLIVRMKQMPDLLPAFVCQYINSPDGQGYVKENEAGSAQLNFGATALSKMPIILPPLDLQEKYLGFVEQSDKSKFIGFKSQFIEHFGDEIVSECRWPVRKMKDVFTITSSKRILKSEWRTEGEIPFLRVRDMVHLANGEPLNNEFYVTEEFYNSRSDDERVRSGDIIVSATSTIGKTYIIKDGERFYFKDADVLLFRKKGVPIDEIFFTYGLGMPTVWRQVEGGLGATTVAHFLISKAEKLLQPLPPIELQEEFAAFVRQSDKSKLKEDFYENRIDTFIKRNTSWLWCWERRN